jgi:hypothetical protein
VGAKGDTGVGGCVGAKGDTGVGGSVGAKGDTGSAGLKGDTGSMSVVTIPPVDNTASGLTLPFTADVTVNFGDICKIVANGNASLGNASAISTSSTIVMCADTTISASASGNFLLFGIARSDSWSWTTGGLIYLSTVGTTGNTLTQTAPSGANNVIQIIGVANDTHRMYFNPQLVQIEHV